MDGWKDRVVIEIFPEKLFLRHQRTSGPSVVQIMVFPLDVEIIKFSENSSIPDDFMI